MQYQDYKTFSEEYREPLVNVVSDHDQCPSYFVFLGKCKIDLDRRAPLKYNYLRSNQAHWWIEIFLRLLWITQG